MCENSKEIIGNTVSFSTDTDTLAIKGCQFKLIEGRKFVTGTIPKGATNNEWAVGQKCAIAWECVTDYMIFESEDIYAALMEKANKYETDKY